MGNILIFPLNSSRLGEVLKDLVSKILFSKVKKGAYIVFLRLAICYFFVKTVLGDHLAFESIMLLRDKKP